jgi:nitrite reductase (NADH) small subunit/3-phenylpropionate/trans-cinnamate dioxygenase ferredoxin subunit
MSKTLKVEEVSELKFGEGNTVEVDGQTLALFNVEGTFYAIDYTCSHVGGPLGEGPLISNEVVCPFHGARFDVTCGKALGGPSRGDVKSFPVSLEGDGVLVELE